MFLILVIHSKTHLNSLSRLNSKLGTRKLGDINETQNTSNFEIYFFEILSWNSELGVIHTIISKKFTSKFEVF